MLNKQEDLQGKSINKILQTSGEKIG